MVRPNNHNLKEKAGAAFKFLVICITASLLLSLVNHFTSALVKKEDNNTITVVIEAMLPGALPGERQPVMDNGYPAVKALYKTKNNAGQSCYILDLQGVGYNGILPVIACYKSDGEVMALKLLDNNETPGWKEQAGSYMKNFIGKGGSKSEYPVPVSKEMSARQQNLPVIPAGKEEALAVSRLLADAFFGTMQSGNPDALTGATITFTGIACAVKAGSDYIKTVIRKNQ